MVPRVGEPRAALEISGPYALFRRTLVYGRALSEILPLLAWCHHFRLQADCVVRGQQLTLRLASGDPIFPGKAPRLYDSKLEERFARDFRRVAPDWDVIREPEAVQAGDTLIFPDFALRHRGDGRRWLVEIVGFWTQDYVERKLELLRVAELPNLVLCIDERFTAQSAPATSGERLWPAAHGLYAPAIVCAYSGFPVDARCGGMSGCDPVRWLLVPLGLGSPPCRRMSFSMRSSG